MKRKATIGFIAAMLALSLTACSSSNSSSSSQPASTQPSETTSDTAAESSSDAASEGTSEAQVTSNSTANSEELFEKFLNDEIEAKLHISLENDLNFVCTDEQDIDGELYVVHSFDSAQSCTLGNLTALVKNSPQIDASGAKASYAVMDTLSGQKALVIRYTNVNIDPSSGGGTAYFVFTDHYGELSLVYAGDSWPRRSLELHEGCVFSSYGSSGAGSSSNAFFFIDDNKYNLIYNQRVLTNQWIAMDYPTFKPGDTEWSNGVTLYLTNTPDDKFFSFVAADSATGETLGSFVEGLMNNGLVYSGNLLGLETERFDKFGLKRDELTPFDNWTDVQ